MFRYDGKSFTNITSTISSPSFWDVLEDRKGNLWFATRDSGVYYYNGKSLPTGQAGFQHFTTREGLANNRVGNIYEDKSGNIWFATGGGASRYDGKSFRNFTTKDGLSNNDITTIMEDKTGKFWFGTRGYLSVYDGKTFTVFRNKDGKAFNNVWSIIEDKKGNIWTSSESAESPAWVGSETGNIQAWALTRYEGKSLSNIKPTVTEITNKGMIFGILEDDKGSIWFGAFDGVHRYDGKTILTF